MDDVIKYLNNLSDINRSCLETIRSLVKENIPEVEEVISYGMPGFKYRGAYLLGYAAFKDHLSLFPTGEPMEHFAKDLQGFKTSRGAIRFTSKKRIPESLIIEIIEYRKEQINKKLSLE